jgi:hypothetical protein
VKSIFVFLLCAIALHGDDARVTAEPNLEKRSRLALDEAESALKEARQSYNAGNTKEAGKQIDEVARYTEMAYAALEATGKNPRKSPKYFKSAEIKSRELIRRLDALALEMDAADRGMVEPAKDRIRKVHEEILSGIMGKKR